VVQRPKVKYFILKLKTVLKSSGAQPAYPMGTSGCFPGGKAVTGMKLITHLQLAPRSRIRGAILPLHQNAFKARCSL